MNNDYDVAIVGYGPAGLVLASYLGGKGHRVIVFERWPSLYGLPRLTHIDGETARILQRVSDLDLALKDALPLETYRWTNKHDEVLVAQNWQGSSSGHPAHLSIYQPDIEDAIDQTVRSTGNVEVRQGWSVINFVESASGVQVTARPWRKDRTGQWSHVEDEVVATAKYVVGADGAGSFVRTTLGVDRSDSGIDERWLNVDVEKLRELPERFGVPNQVCDEDRGHMYMPVGRSRQRFELALLDGEDEAPFEDVDFAWKWLKESYGLDQEDVRILRQVVYRFSGKIAESWRRGRVFLAGDAAHTTPPYMGQGACSAMRDGITLGWKLDLVLRGRSDDALLDTYESERRPHVTAIVETSTALARVANMHDPVEAAARDEAFRTGIAPPPPPFPTVTSGVIHHGSDGHVSPLAGTLAPQGVITGRNDVQGLFDDVVGSRSGFALVASQDTGAFLSPEHHAFLDALGAAHVIIAPDSPNSVNDVDGTYEDFWRGNDVEAFISRPDFHLFWAGKLVDLPAVLDDLRARLTWSAVPAAT